MSTSSSLQIAIFAASAVTVTLMLLWTFIMWRQLNSLRQLWPSKIVPL